MGIPAAFQFLTVCPPIVRRPFAPREMGRAVGSFPLVGLVIGGLLVGVDWLAGRVLPTAVSAAVLIGIWIAVTGALHFDGLLDSLDGLLAGRSPEDRIRILSDERVGSYAVAGGGIVLLLQYGSLLSLADRTHALLLAPIAGRWAMSLVIVSFPYAKPEGLGRAMADHGRFLDFVLATAIAIGAFVLVDWRGGAVVLAASLTTALGVSLFALRRLPGLTGDVYGAVCVLSETAALVTTTALR